jgi:hypothetical protein
VTARAARATFDLDFEMLNAFNNTNSIRLELNPKAQLPDPKFSGFGVGLPIWDLGFGIWDLKPVLCPFRTP